MQLERPVLGGSGDEVGGDEGAEELSGDGFLMRIRGAEDRVALQGEIDELEDAEVGEVVGRGGEWLGGFYVWVSMFGRREADLPSPGTPAVRFCSLLSIVCGAASTTQVGSGPSISMLSEPMRSKSCSCSSR